MTDYAMILDSGMFADRWTDIERIMDCMTQAECSRAFRLFAVKMATAEMTCNPDPNTPIYNMRAALRFALEDAGDLTLRGYPKTSNGAFQDDGRDEEQPPF